MQTPIKAVFFDIDGTLVSFATHSIPQTTIDAVAQLRRNGIKVYIATGRPLAFIDNLGTLQYDGMITVTGAHCFTSNGRTISTIPVAHTDVARVVHHLENTPKPYPVIFVGTNTLFATQHTTETNQVADLLNIKIPPIRPAACALNTDILQMISFFPAHEEPDLMKTLMPKSTALRWHPLFVDIVNEKVDKSVGIDNVLAYENIPLSQTMAFGDGGNDIAMLRHVPLGIAMGNAPESLKSVADYVTASVDDNGVARALQHFGLIS